MRIHYKPHFAPNHDITVTVKDGIQPDKLREIEMAAWNDVKPCINALKLTDAPGSAKVVKAERKFTAALTLASARTLGMLCYFSVSIDYADTAAVDALIHMQEATA